MIKVEYNYDDETLEKLNQLEKRLNNLFQMKWDLYGVPEDNTIRQELHSIEYSILLTYLLIQNIISDTYRWNFNEATDEFIQDKIIELSKENEDGI